MLKFPVYLDYNSTTPCDPRVVEAMSPFFSEIFGNPSTGSHAFGWQAEEAVNIAREQVGALIRARPREVVFTSGATEAINLAIKGVVELYGGKGKHVITLASEHKAVLETCKHIEQLGAEVTVLPVDADGFTDPDKIESAIRPGTVLIAVMYANNEVGTVQPIRDIGAVARRHGVLLFSDATQAIGKIPVDVTRDNIDLMAFSSHKLYGPKGVGALYLRSRGPKARVSPQIDGGGQESGMRSGTLNVPGIVGFGKACEISTGEMESGNKRIEAMRNRLESALIATGETLRNGSIDRRLPNVSNLSFKDVESAALIAGLRHEIAVSAGSSCNSRSMEPSHVLSAMGISDEVARGSVRFSLGRPTTDEEIAFTIEAVSAAVRKLREEKTTWEVSS